MDLFYTLLISLLIFSAAWQFWRYAKSLDLHAMKRSRLLLVIAMVWLALMWWIKVEGLPRSSAESHLTLSFLFLNLAFFSSFRKRARFFVGFCLLFCLLSLWLSYFVRWLPAADFPNRPWLWVHVYLMILGQAFLALAAGLGALIWWLRRTLKAGQGFAWLTRLPDLPSMSQALIEACVVGFILLTVGMLLGLHFASEFWTNWWLDPKFILCAMAWAFYAVLFSIHFSRVRDRDLKIAKLSVVGLLVMMVVSFAMDFLLPSQHHQGANQAIQESPTRMIPQVTP